MGIRFAMVFMVVSFLVGCAPTPEIIQKAIEQTQAAWTATPTPKLLPTSYSEISNQEWRLTPPPENDEFIYDEDADNYFDTVIYGRAKELNITPPYNWEAYYLPHGYTYHMLENHYATVLMNSKFRLVKNVYSDNDGVGLLAFKRSPMIIDVVFWDSTKVESRPHVLVIYKNF